MKHDFDKYNRRSIRLKGWDYSGSADYFITICTRDRECLFGEIIDNEMVLNKLGRVAKEWWLQIPKYYENVELDEYIIMPNHIHGVIAILGDDHGRGGVTPPLQNKNKPTLGKIVAYFKYQSTKQINEIQNSQGNPIWQRNYWEHIVRNEKSLNNTRDYIRGNPEAWGGDRNNPVNIK